MSNTSPGERYDVDSSKGVLAFGVTTFAGVLLAVVSVFQVLQGIAAIANDTVFVRGLSYTWEFDVTAWGWIHLIIGILTAVVGVAVLRGVTWGWILGIVLTGLSALTNFVYLPHYPWWAITIIALDVLIIWALTNKLKLAS
jgi:hypothetical protein